MKTPCPIQESVQGHQVPNFHLFLESTSVPRIGMSMEQALKCTTHILKTLCDSTATSGYRIRRLFVVQGTSLLDETYHQQLAGVSCQQALLQGSSPWLGKANATTVFGLARRELVPAVDNHFPKQPDLAWQPLSSLSGARMIKKTNRDSFTPGHRNKQTRARLSSVKERVFDYTTPLSCLKLLLCWGEHTKLLPPPIGTETRHSRPRRNPP